MAKWAARCSTCIELTLGQTDSSRLDIMIPNLGRLVETIRGLIFTISDHIHMHNEINEKIG